MEPRETIAISLPPSLRARVEDLVEREVRFRTKI
jgi:hypothetical protein